MALVANIKDGQVVESASQTSLNKANKASGSNMDKDAFLQLLVAQMKYQDPLEPTSNTEYIAQYAQFTQVEEMQNMAQSMDLQRASALVGKEVYIKTTNSQGEPSLVRGKVDYVVYENGKAFLSINEALYSIDDLDTVADKDYLDASDKALKFVVSVNKLPALHNVTESDVKTIDAIAKEYDEMSDYEKSFVANDVVKALKKYIEAADRLRPGEEEPENPPEDEESADE